MKKEDILSIVPLLPAQQFMLSASLREGQKTYVQQLLFVVRNVDGKALEAAVEKIVQAYECLRSIILYEGLKQPVWVSLKNMKPKFGFHQMTENELESFCATRLSSGFILDKEAAMGLDWIETASKTYLLFTYHHILFDGWGRQKILADLLFALRYPQAIIQPKLNKNWYEAWKKLNHAAAIDAYKNYLSNFDQIAGLSAHGNGQRENCSLTQFIEEAVVVNAAKALGLTQAEYVLFAWTCFVVRWSNKENVQLGQVKQNGLIDSCRDGFGLGIQTMPFQLKVDFNEKISDILNRFKARERALSPYAYADTSNEIFHQLRYDFIIAFENYPIEKSLAAQEQDFILRSNYDFSEFPLSLAISPKDGQLILDWHYNLVQHSTAQIELTAKYFTRFLEKFAEYSSVKLCEIELWDKPAMPEFSLKIEAEAFFQKIESKLAKQDRSNLYNRLRSYFIEKQIKRIWLVGDKHAHSDLVFVAAWRSGIEVLSLNEKESPAFIEKLLEEHPADLIFTSESNHLVPEAISLDRLEQLPDNPSIKVKEKSAAALSICTSGSTGTPKVVQLSLENLLAFFEAWDAKLPWKSTEVFAAIAHPAFDIGVAELIFPLWKGWETQLINKETLSDSEKLQEALRYVTAFHMVPSLLENWIDYSEADDKSRIIMTGGDKVPPHLQTKLHRKFPQTKLFQFYGPSECSVLASGFENKGQYETQLLPLGTAFAHCGLLIFDNDDKAAAPFQEGEIIVFGPAVGLGYANTDNKEKFFEYRGQKAYRTGDLGFSDAEGNLFFKGRKDNQIKINGQRIELSRIESALAEWSGIEHWVALSDGKQVFAFAKSEKPSKLAEREQLQNWLPFYAIPGIIEYLPEFPLNKNGKVDRQKLMEIAENLKLQSTEKALDANMEAILKELFPNKIIQSSASWYANGFNSIDALKFSGLLKTKLKINIEINKILGISCLADLNIVGSKASGSDEIIIEAGQELYSTAARILFLSESDEQFFRSYWINSGIILPKDSELAAIKNWIIKQQNLHLSALAKDNKYIWKKAAPAIFELKVKDKQEFINFVEQKFLPTNTGLFMSFIGSAGNENYLAFKVNHALLDGLGLENLWKKLQLDLSTGSFSEIKLIAPKEEKIDRAFWANYIEPIEIKALPFERQNSHEKAVGRFNFVLSQHEKEKLQNLCSEYKCSLFEAGLILFSNLWKNYYPVGHQAVGVPVNIGTYGAENHIPAMSVNILPFRTDAENADEILKNWRLLFEKRNTPFSEIAQLDQKQKSGLPFFNTTYLYHSQKETQKNFEALDFKRTDSDYALSLDFIEEERDFIFSWEYRKDLYTETAIRKIQQNFFKKEPKKTTKFYAESGSLKMKWERQLSVHANKNALYFEDKKLSYAELDVLLSAYSNEYSKNPEGIDVLILERNEHAVAKLLFHLIEEIPFIPVDSETSEDRIAHLKSLAKNIRLSDEVNQELQYVIATSGTTGLPKLVGVSKKGYAAAVEAWISDYGINASDCIMQAASFSFDVSLGDIGRTFFKGASMLLLSAAERKDPVLMLEKIDKFYVTVFETTPIIARWWLSDAVSLSKYPRLRLLIVGSDSWKMNELRSLFKTKGKNQRIISSYGLSETTIDNSFFDPETDDRPEYPGEMSVPIGCSMSHCELKIVDKASKSLKYGIEGFICITGPAVGFGYFVDGKWTNPEALNWQSADKGIVDEWGICHFRGRSDRQVKIRGQRVELEEIENILSAVSPGVNWQIADFEQEFSVEMAAFYQGNLDETVLLQIKKQILAKYPAYYLPTLFIQIDKIPLNINGKTDMAALRKIALSKFSRVDALKQDNAVLEQILNLYEQCFNEKADPAQHFFQKGKNSFDAMHFVRSWNRLSDQKMAVHQLFGAENFGNLANLISITSQKSEKKQDALRRISKAQEAIWFEIKNGNSTLYNLPHFVEIPESYDLAKLKNAFEKTLKACPALFVKFEENELGDVFEMQVDFVKYQLPQIEIDDLGKFREQAYLKEINLLEGPAFEATLLSSDVKNYLYFNPHHLVYDGGSDAALLNIFRNFYEGNNEIIESNNEEAEGNPIDWENYFKLLPRPEIYFRKADNSIQQAVLIPASIEESKTIQQIAADYQCTPTVVITQLLSKALHSTGINIQWLSLAVDHRTGESVGMQMRAYPFPAYDSENSTELNIAKQKWALAQLFAAVDQQVIYPENIAVQSYHQVGLIIQHPFILENYEPKEKVENARPRLPLTLYVEQINDQYLYRWEFDHSQIGMDKIRTIHLSFFNLAKELALENKQIISYKPEGRQNSTIEKTEQLSPELKQIWEKYTDSQKLGSQHFFEAGANSIKALLMLKEIEKSLQVRISTADFFKEPTLKFLNSAVQKTDNLNLIWKLKEGSSKHELWLLPPIMGFGFIFNSLNLPENTCTYAFSYPAAMGQNSCKSIEEIARLLLREREALGNLPEEVILLGYSMGGLTAFEMAKWLEENGVRVKKLIILDKTAQPENGKIVQKVDLKGELIDIARQIAADDEDLNRINDYLGRHEMLIDAYHQQGSVSCPIDVFYCEKGFPLNDFLKWKRFSSSEIKINSIANCSHYEIPKIWNTLNIEF